MGNALTIAGAGLNADSILAETVDDNALGLFTKGKRVDRATEALTSEAIFTVTGTVLVTQILGEVTTVLETAANAVKLQANPTATGSSVDLCATLDVNAKPLATLFGITGTLADAMLSGLAIKGQADPVIVQAGTIDLACADDSTTGSAKWSCWYVPLTEDATVVAA